MLPMTINRHHYTYSDYLMQCYIAMLINSVCAACRMTQFPAFSLEMWNHIQHIEDVREATLVNYSRPQALILAFEPRREA